MTLVVGGSIGAPIAGTAQNTDYDFLFTYVLTETITSDPEFQEGEYSSNSEAPGLERHAVSGAVMGFSTKFWKQRVYPALDFPDMNAFLESFLQRRENRPRPSHLS